MFCISNLIKVYIFFKLKICLYKWKSLFYSFLSSNSKYEIRKTKVYMFLFMKCKNQSSNLTLLSVKLKNKRDDSQ